MEEKKEKNIVIFPFMAQGHIIPFLAFALQIQKKGYQITFVNTPLNIKNLKQSLPLNTSFCLLEIPFNSSDHGLPPETENTDSIPMSLSLTLLEVSVSLKPAFRNLISNLIRGGAPPLAVVADMFFGWTAEVAHEFGIFHTIFSSTGGFGMACHYSVWTNLPHHNTAPSSYPCWISLKPAGFTGLSFRQMFYRRMVLILCLKLYSFCFLRGWIRMGFCLIQLKNLIRLV